MKVFQRDIRGEFVEEIPEESQIGVSNSLVGIYRWALRAGYYKICQSDKKIWIETWDNSFYWIAE